MSDVLTQEQRDELLIATARVVLQLVKICGGVEHVPVDDYRDAVKDLETILEDAAPWVVTEHEVDGR